MKTNVIEAIRRKRSDGATVAGPGTNKIYGLTCMLALSLLIGSAAAPADVVTDWNAIAVNTAVANQQNPFAQARYAAIVQLAVFEAVNSITHKYHPYLGTITAPADASPEAAVEAAYQVLSNYFPTSQPALFADWTNSMQMIPDGTAKTEGIATGDAAAAAMIALRANDGSSPSEFFTPGPPAPGAWQATSSCPLVNGVASGIAFQWQNVTPFGIPSASNFLLDPPPVLTSARYAKAYNEVKTVGSLDSTERPPDRANVALFYASTSPTQAFNQAAEQLAAVNEHSLSANARIFALINMAMSDSLVAAFYNKYFYVFWRPETAIHAGDSDGNSRTIGDPNWAPFIVTPCFPSYPSNHGSASSAAAVILKRYYGDAGLSLTLTNPAVPDIVLQYTSLKQILDDISDARVYGGIHFRTDQTAGTRLGRLIGIAVFENNLRRKDDDH